MSASQKITAALQQHIGQNHGDIIRSIYADFDAYNDARIIPGVKNEIRLTSLLINDLIKPYSNTFSATVDAIEFKPRTMRINRGKAEVTVDPEDYRYTYLAHFQKGGMGRTPDDLPASQFIMEDLIAKVQEQINTEVAYKGVYNTVITPPATTLGAADITNGWGTQLAAMIVAGEVTPITTGALTAANAYTKVRDMWRAIPEKFRKKTTKMRAFMSLNTYEKIQDELESKNYNTGKDADMLEPKFLRGTNNLLELKPVSWMAGSNRVFITPADNLCLLADDTDSDLNEINIEQKMYTADLSITFAIGFDFATNLIWANDQV